MRNIKIASEQGVDPTFGHQLLNTMERLSDEIIARGW